MEPTIAATKVRLSDRVQSLTLLAQLLVAGRVAVELIGLADSAPGSYLVWASDPVVRPLYGLLPPVEIGWYIIDPAGGLAMILLALVAAAAVVGLNGLRIRRKERLFPASATPL